MAETKIIPVDLKKLVCWRVGQNGDDLQDDLVQKFMAAALTPRKVTPLDICDLRRTQRRVATLLGQSQRVAAPEKHRRKRWNLPTISYVCRNDNSNSGSVWADNLQQPVETSNKDCPHRLNKGQAGKQDLFHLSEDRLYLHGQPGSDQCPVEGLSLPPVVQTMDTARYAMNNKPRPANKANFSQDWTAPVTSSLTLPALDRTASGTTTSDNSIEVNKNQRFGSLAAGQSLKTSTRVSDPRYLLDPNSAALHDWLLQSTTLETQRSWGSLKIDEDYVPMRVSVKKLTSMDVAKDGTSLYQEFSDFFTSSSSSGSAYVPRSRDNTLLSIYTDSSSSSIVPRARSGTWCTCPTDVSKLLPSNGGRCLECSMTGGDHDGWCLSRGDVCLHCHRPVMSSRDGHNMGRPRVVSDTSRELTDEALTIRKLTDTSFVRKTPSSSSHSGQRFEEQEAGAIETYGAQRVHFAETVQEKIISRNSYSDASPNPLMTGSADVSVTHATLGDSGTLDLGQGLSSKVAKRARIHPNIHRDAYTLAVKDAHAHVKTRGKKKSKKRKGEGNMSQAAPATGIVFSYFPLLKRSVCDANPEPIKDLGLRQDEGRKLKLKHAMKHILGKAKLGDYYPGGKKYSPQY